MEATVAVTHSLPKTPELSGRLAAGLREPRCSDHSTANPSKPSWFSRINGDQQHGPKCIVFLELKSVKWKVSLFEENLMNYHMAIYTFIYTSIY